MKPKFYLLLFISAALTFASCTKWMPGGQQNIAGTWRIASVERQTAYGSEYVHTGYENGTFYFNNSGSAQFEDSYGRMEGSWRLVQRPGDGSSSLELRLYDYYNDDAIEWEFYTIEVSGNRMYGYMNRYGYDYRYEFRRY